MNYSAKSSGKKSGVAPLGKRTVVTNIRHRALASAHKGGGSSIHSTPKSRRSSV